MSAALIPSTLVPVARTDADWAFDLMFPAEDWTGSEVRIAFARQGAPVCTFEVIAASPTSEAACAIRIPAGAWADRPIGTYSAQVRRIDDAAIDDAAVFSLRLVRGVSDLVAEPASGPVLVGDGSAVGSVVVSRQSVVSVVRGGAGPVGPQGPNEAALVSFDDTATQLGADNVNDAIASLYAVVLAQLGLGFVQFSGAPIFFGSQPVIAEI
ncbi:hypothetical protein [Brevundimonas subvibrioides]|uniref:Uncharacterized protein n=1 Tax=Brevundimonas subvibrioides (strain ATCC 15264 / DSM 4735 / LMG 14903 / NBRC 16000 / CB 81) TaxID=633149 RepID=D9QFZ5_BRESC|nr:hypothetical protein [Brevundimonas subvibrioides]ADL00709.1 hypothetical protein Bresu_1397 [Brevundimonas subvibrioides ATCC 15264]